MAKVLDGKWLAGEIRANIATRVRGVVAEVGRPPGLGVILVGDNSASRTYVASKEKAAVECGFKTVDRRLQAAVSFAEVSAVIDEFNTRDDIDGILMQLPLPSHLPTRALLDRISPTKDADGLHPLNQGLLLRGDMGHTQPCTPLGIMKLLDLAYSDVEIGKDVPAKGIPEADLTGKKAVVLGRSLLVGKPIAVMLLSRNATVIMGHSKTREVDKLCREGDILVAAVGVPRLVKAEWVRDGAVVLDVGINRLPDGSLVGDVDYAAVANRTYAITPVPGGVGPLTVAMLMANTFDGYLKRTQYGQS